MVLSAIFAVIEPSLYSVYAISSITPVLKIRVKFRFRHLRRDHRGDRSGPRRRFGGHPVLPGPLVLPSIVAAAACRPHCFEGFRLRFQ